MSQQIPKNLLSQLSTFLVVAETSGFRLAAEQLNLTQPAISLHIANLEDYFEATLIVRKSKFIELTAAGNFVYERAKKILGDTDQLIADVRSSRYMAINQISISLAPTISANLVSETLANFQSANPSVRVLISEHLGQQMFESLSKREIQFGVGPYRNVPFGISFSTLFQQELFLIIHDSHPLVKRGRALISDLLELPLLCAAPGTTAREVLDHALLTHGYVITPKYEAIQFHTLFALAAAQHGATVMPLVNPDLLAAMHLVPLAFQDFPMRRSIGLIKRDDDDLDRLSTGFLRDLITVAKRTYAPVTVPPELQFEEKYEAI